MIKRGLVAVLFLTGLLLSPSLFAVSNFNSCPNNGPWGGNTWEASLGAAQAICQAAYAIRFGAGCPNSSYVYSSGPVSSTTSSSTTIQTFQGWRTTPVNPSCLYNVFEYTCLATYTWDDSSHTCLSNAETPIPVLCSAKRGTDTTVTYPFSNASLVFPYIVDEDGCSVYHESHGCNETLNICIATYRYPGSAAPAEEYPEIGVDDGLVQDNSITDVAGNTLEPSPTPNCGFINDVEVCPESQGSSCVLGSNGSWVCPGDTQPILKEGVTVQPAPDAVIHSGDGVGDEYVTNIYNAATVGENFEPGEAEGDDTIGAAYPDWPDESPYGDVETAGTSVSLPAASTTFFSDMFPNDACSDTPLPLFLGHEMNLNLCQYIATIHALIIWSLSLMMVISLWFELTDSNKG